MLRLRESRNEETIMRFPGKRENSMMLRRSEPQDTDYWLCENMQFSGSS